MEHDHMIEAFATNGSDHPLDIGSLPRRARCRQHFANAHVSHVFSEVIAKDRIVVAQEVARELGKGKCLAQLLSGPICGRVGGHIEVQDATPVMGQHQKYVKDLEPDGGHGEEVGRDQLLGMVLQEGAPSLRRRFAAAQRHLWPGENPTNHRHDPAVQTPGRNAVELPLLGQALGG